MISTQQYFLIMKILATVTLLVSGLLESIYHPGPLDTLNGAAEALAIYAIWRASDKSL
jgi:hypothetical protein